MTIKKQVLYIFLMLAVGMGQAQITGLSGWNIFLDPGHSQKENMGKYNYSEAEKNLGVGLELRELLLSRTDIDTVYISRTNDQEIVSLYDRTHRANTLGAAWYHSIHSDAGAETSNNTLLLYGQYNNGEEKTPKGGKALSDIMIQLLTDGMRIPTRGSYGDCSFYTWSNYCAENGGPYLYVNSNTTMTSELSEAGYHTNPTQNTRNMNVEWKRMEAWTMLWSILKLHNIERPKVRILAGYIKNAEGGRTINGATASTQGRSYTTDTYASLFHNYNSDSTLLHNGFYFIEDLDDNADSSEVVFSAPGFYSDTLMIHFRDDFITFIDPGLVSSVPPTVISSYPANNDTAFSVLDDIEIDFSRPMNKTLMDSLLTTDPQINGRHIWSENNSKLTIKPDSLRFNTDYTITIPADCRDAKGHFFDGNGDGVAGDGYVLQFKTDNDVYAPELVSNYPTMNLAQVERRPLIRLQYDEILDTTSVTEEQIKLEYFKEKTYVPGALKIYNVDKKSVVQFVPDENLLPNTLYVIRISPGIADMLGNVSDKSYGISFNTGGFAYQGKGIDNFDSGTSFWWAPDQSGSTTGILSGTSKSNEDSIVNPLSGSITSMKINYAWDTGAGSWLLREYLAAGPPRSVTFTGSYILQAYVFGDNSGNKIRFAIDDDINGNASHEVSPWFIVDWSGWKLLSWDMANDGTGSWIGDGNITGTLRFDSFQLTYTEGAKSSGTVYFDDLRAVQKVDITALEDKTQPMPLHFELGQNYPNPFNPSTRIQYQLAEPGAVELHIYNALGQQIATLVQEKQAAGTYTVQWSGRDMRGREVPSGIYFYRLKSGSQIAERKMVLIH